MATVEADEKQMKQTITATKVDIPTVALLVPTTAPIDDASATRLRRAATLLLIICLPLSFNALALLSGLIASLCVLLSSTQSLPRKARCIKLFATIAALLAMIDSMVLTAFVARGMPAHCVEQMEARCNAIPPQTFAWGMTNVRSWMHHRHAHDAVFHLHGSSNMARLADDAVDIDEEVPRLAKLDEAEEPPVTLRATDRVGEHRNSGRDVEADAGATGYTWYDAHKDREHAHAMHHSQHPEGHRHPDGPHASDETRDMGMPVIDRLEDMLQSKPAQPAVPTIAVDPTATTSTAAVDRPTVEPQLVVDYAHTEDDQAYYCHVASKAIEEMVISFACAGILMKMLTFLAALLVLKRAMLLFPAVSQSSSSAA